MAKSTTKIPEQQAPKKNNVKPISTQKVRRISRNAIVHVAVENNALTPNIISLDGGNGMNEAWRVNQDDKVQSIALPHGRVPVTGDTFDSDVAVQQHELDWFEWRGSNAYENGELISEPFRYGYGDGVIQLSTSAPDQHRNDVDRYAGDQQMSMFCLMAAKLGIPSGSELTVIVPVPPSMLAKLDLTQPSVAKKIRHTIKSGEDGKGDGKWSIRLKSDKSWREYFITNVVVIPEGLGAAYAYRFKLSGEVAKLNHYSAKVDDMAGIFKVHDIGFGTYDVITFLNGMLAPDSIRRATDPTGGIQEHIARPIINKVAEMTGIRVTEMHVDYWLRTWSMNRFAPEAATFTVGSSQESSELEMYNLFYRLVLEYAEWISREKIGPDWNTGVNAIGAAGGGWNFIDNMITQKYNQRKILLPNMYDHISWLPPHSLNGYGGLVYLADVLRNGN